MKRAYRMCMSSRGNTHVPATPSSGTHPIVTHTRSICCRKRPSPAQNPSHNSSTASPSVTHVLRGLRSEWGCCGSTPKIRHLVRCRSSSSLVNAIRCSSRGILVLLSSNTAAALVAVRRKKTPCPRCLQPDMLLDLELV